MPFWHLAFVATIVLASVWASVELHGARSAWRLPTELGLYGALALWYFVTPRKWGSPGWAQTYLAGAFAIYTAAAFVFPGAGFLLFVLIPHCFMCLRVRAAYVGVVGLVAVTVGSGLAFSGASSANLSAELFFGVVSLIFSVFMGGYINRIIEQSLQRAALIEQLQQARSEVVELSTHAGALAERERLAREIHDALAQGFTSVLLLLGAAQAALDRGDLVSVRRQLALAEPAAREGLSEARSLIAALAPVPLQDGPLVGALQRVCEDIGSRFGFATQFALSGTGQPLSHNAEIVLLRAAQEALVNTGKHAAAASASVSLCFTGKTVYLEVADDGRGIAPARGEGFGLRQMRARAEELGGTASVCPGRAGGTVVRVELPLGRVGQPSPKTGVPA